MCGMLNRGRGRKISHRKVGNYHSRDDVLFSQCCSKGRTLVRREAPALVTNTSGSSTVDGGVVAFPMASSSSATFLATSGVQTAT